MSILEVGPQAMEEAAGILGRATVGKLPDSCETSWARQASYLEIEQPLAKSAERVPVS